MAVKGKNKTDIIDEYKQSGKDTGSPEVQIALLSFRIDKLVGHLKENSNDDHSRRGLLGMISKRRRMLKYIYKKSEDRYKEIISRVGLKK
jgi:small subunit ribosomal protein S15